MKVVKTLLHCSNVTKRTHFSQCLYPILNPIRLNTSKIIISPSRFISISSINLERTEMPKDALNKDQIVKWQKTFKQESDDKAQDFKDAITIYLQNNKNRKGQLEFIYAALKQMEKHGVHKDVEAYKAIFSIFPKTTMVPTNMFQEELYHFPYHQDCAIAILEQMENNGAIPDREMRRQILDTFGPKSGPYKKYARMCYWMSKFRYESPFPLPNPLPKDILALAKLGMKRMCPDVLTNIVTYEASSIEESLDKTWIVSGESPAQQDLMEAHNPKEALYIEGPFSLWLRDVNLAYFTLRAKPMVKLNVVEPDIDDVSYIPIPMLGEKALVNPEKDKTVHEQDTGIILGTCITGTSSKDSLLSWLRMLEQSNTCLKKMTVVFTIKTPHSEIVEMKDDQTTERYKEFFLPKNMISM